MNQTQTHPKPQVEAQELSDCPVCMESVAKDNIYVIDGCNHLVCKPCAVRIKKTKGMFTWDSLEVKLIKCPVCRNIETLSVLRARNVAGHWMKKAQKLEKEIQKRQVPPPNPATTGNSVVCFPNQSSFDNCYYWK